MNSIDLYKNLNIHLAKKVIMKAITPKNLNMPRTKKIPMKFLFEFEDAVIGVICGLLLIGLTGRFFSLELGNIVYLIVFILFSISIILDVLFEFSDLKVHFVFTVISIAHSIVDFIISLAFISHFSGLNIPFITNNLVPYLQNEAIIFWIGIFLAASNAVWLISYPFFDK